MLTSEQERILRLARKAIDNYLPNIQDSAEMAQEFAPIIRPWIAGTVEEPIEYKLNDLRTENGAPYKCTSPHTHYGEEGWNPENGTSLWRRYHGTTSSTAWEFTSDGANPYLKGEYCIENDMIYKCLIDNTVYAPSILPSNWEKFIEGNEESTPEIEEPETEVEEPNTETVSPWKQPDGTNPYKEGDKVTYNSKIWISTTNGNVWEPGIYGWEEVTE